MNKFLNKYPQLLTPRVGSVIISLDKEHQNLKYGAIGEIVDIFEFYYKIKSNMKIYLVFKDKIKVIGHIKNEISTIISQSLDT